MHVSVQCPEMTSAVTWRYINKLTIIEISIANIGNIVMDILKLQVSCQS